MAPYRIRNSIIIVNVILFDIAQLSKSTWKSGSSDVERYITKC